MKRIALIFALAVIVCCFPYQARCEIVDRIVAIVNDDIITLTELERFVPVERHGKFVSINEYFRNIKLREKIDPFIDNLLIKQEAKRLKIDVPEKEVRGMVENIKKQYLVTEKELKEQLEKEHINYRDFIEGLKTNSLRGKVLSQAISPEVLVTDKMLQDYYDKHVDEYREESYSLRQIFVSNKAGDSLKKATEAYALLKAGMLFEAAAKEFSDDPSAADGGNIGVVKSDELMPELRAVVQGLEPGGYTGVTKTPYGYLILKLVEVKRGETIPFDAVRDSIQQRIVREESEKRYKDFIGKLRKVSYVEVKI